MVFAVTKVCGYTEAKETKEVGLTPKRIVETGIDPWRLDLFDAAPIILPDLDLRFSRLADISFIYANPQDETEMYLCLYDGETASALVGNWRNVDFHVHIVNARVSERSFAEHFEEYLELKTPDNNIRPPKPASAVCVVGGELRFSATTPSYHSGNLYFTGRMCEEYSAPHPLDERINKVLIELAQWNPLVLGMYLRRSLTGKRPDTIHLYLDKEGMKRLWRMYDARSNLSALEFTVDGCTYSAWSRKEGFALRELAAIESELHSVNWLSASKPNQLFGSRIAFFDCAQGQCRALRASCGINEKMKAWYAGEGLSVIDSRRSAAII